MMAIAHFMLYIHYGSVGMAIKFRKVDDWYFEIFCFCEHSARPYRSLSDFIF